MSKLQEEKQKNSDSGSEGSENEDVMGSGLLEQIPQKGIYSPIDFTPFLPPIGTTKRGDQVFMHKGKGDLVIFCLHGAGHSGASFAPLAEALVSKGDTTISIASIDLPGHGVKKGEEIHGEIDYSSANLIESVKLGLDLVSSSIPEARFVLLGHSLGGALVGKLAKVWEPYRWGKGLAGLIILDVAEGTAKDALPAMAALLMKQKKSFNNIEEAIAEAVNRGEVRNRRSARMTVPSRLKQKTSDDKNQKGSETDKWIWRTKLENTEPYWKDWFEGMNSGFLGLNLPKMMVMAGEDRLDQELTIAQMQGKFRLVTLHGVGHVLHEDDPSTMASTLLEFVKIFRLAETPNVSGAGKWGGGWAKKDDVKFDAS